MTPIHLPVNELKTALCGLSKIIVKRPTHPVTAAVLIHRHHSGELNLSSTDFDHYVVYTFQGKDVTESAQMLVPFEDLNNAAKGCAAGDILTLSLVNSSTATMRFPLCGQTGEHRCKAHPIGEFPAIPKVRAQIIPLNEAIRNSLQEAFQCTSDDPARQVLNGAFLDVSKAGAHYLVGTNGRHLFSANSFALPLKQPLIIPNHRFLAWRGFYLDGEWVLKVQNQDSQDPAHLELSSQRWKFISRLMEGNYPNWQACVPAPSNYKASVRLNPDQQEFLSRTAQRMPTHDDQHQTIGLELAKGSLFLLAKAEPELPWMKVEILGTRTNGTDAIIFLDKRLLIKAMKFGLACIEVIDDISPLRFSQAGRQMIVMPIRGGSASPPPIPTTSTQPIKVESGPLHEQPSVTFPASTRTIASPPIEEIPPVGGDPFDAALEQLTGMKEVLRTALSSVSSLTVTIKQMRSDQKSTTRELHSFRNTLRSLQKVPIK